MFERPLWSGSIASRKLRAVGDLAAYSKLLSRPTATHRLHGHDGQGREYSGVGYNGVGLSAGPGVPDRG